MIVYHLECRRERSGSFKLQNNRQKRSFFEMKKVYRNLQVKKNVCQQCKAQNQTDSHGVIRKTALNFGQFFAEHDCTTLVAL